MYLGKWMFLKANVLAIALLVFGAATCVAQRLDFSIDGGSSFGNAFDVVIGSTSTVEVYLSEISPDTTLSTEGLFGLGLLGELEAGAAGTITAASINAQFDFVNSETFNATALEWEAAVLSNSVPTGPAILLGEVQFASSSEGVSIFTFSDLVPGSSSAEGNWITGLGTELDESIFGPGATGMYTLTLTAIPEPCALPLLMASSVLVFRRKR